MSKPVTDAKSGMQAALTILFSHTADVFQGIVEAIADKYKLDKEEMISVIVAHPAFTEIKLHPILQELGPEPSALEHVPVKKAMKKVVVKPSPEPAPSVEASVEALAEPTPSVEALPEPTPSVEAVKSKKFKVKKIAAAATTS